MRKIILVLLLIFVMNIYAQENMAGKVLESFSWLQHTDTQPLVFYDASLSRINKLSDNKYIDQEIGKIKFSRDSDYMNVSTISFPNGSPGVSIEYFNAGIKKSMVFKARAVIIPGTGSIYAISDKSIYFGDSENIKFYDKYVYKDGEFRLVDQPLYPVGYATWANEKIILYESLEYKDAVGIIPEEGSVTVIGVRFFKGIHLLLQTKFGLTGWHRFSPVDVHNTTLYSVILSPDG